ncbi:Uncharacterised protein [Kingella potus]|uniref:Relaxation protein n=1 Tax=Kingella potus TaxID=265175 RepID=A0A377R0V3_9NEIS|nr:hypothetical protein [Kingella potus]UOP00433.1 hypothetical protein LVJ84_11210 [Kingella potus]STR02500.1 Uncharacterised protein [Kingella potus]
MNERQLEQLIEQTALLMRNCQKQCEDFSTSLKQDHQKFLQEMHRNTVQNIRAEVKEGMGGEFARYSEELHSLSNSLQHQTRMFQMQFEENQRKNQQTVFRAWLAVSISLGLLLIGGLWMIFHYKGIIEQSKRHADYVQAINTADIVQCGDSLCARVGKQKAGKYNVILKK